jgi:hypothetical protein
LSDASASATSAAAAAVVLLLLLPSFHQFVHSDATFLSGDLVYG